MKNFIVQVIIFLFLIIASSIGISHGSEITVHYNSKGKIMNTHYNAPGSGSANVIITVDLLFENGKYIKCIDTYIAGGAVIGFGRITSPKSIVFIPNDNTHCIKIQ